MPTLKLAAAALAALALSGCVVAPYPARPVVYGPVAQDAPYDDGSGVVVDVAPPPPRVEVVPAMPYAGAVWVGGYWGWASRRHYWVPGRWHHARPGYRWRPRVWVPSRGHWQLRGGGWVRG